MTAAIKCSSMISSLASAAAITGIGPRLSSPTMSGGVSVSDASVRIPSFSLFASKPAHAEYATQAELSYCLAEIRGLKRQVDKLQSENNDLCDSLAMLKEMVLYGQ